MRARYAVVIALAGAMVGALLSGPGAAAAPAYGEVTVKHIIPTRAGKLYAEIVHPTLNDKIVKAPTILTISPYSSLGRNGDAERWVPRGYARAWVDVVGTGNSGGCYDYGADRERKSGYDVVEWIAKQKWSTGKIGMIGGSYDGTTATATATMNPPHLTTIVPEAAISRWYSYAYSGGIRYAFNNEKLGNEGVQNGFVVDEQGFDTPIAFDFGFAAPPPLDPDGEDYVERVQSDVEPCDELVHVQGAYDNDTPTYDKFWLDRDYVKDAHKIDIPVLVSHNWGDWNVKQEEAWNLYRALTSSPKKVLYMGTRWHNHGTPGGDYDKHVDMWMDHYLKGVDNGIDKLPSVISQTSDYEGPLGFKKGMPKTKPVELIAQEAFLGGQYNWSLLPTDPIFFPGTAPTTARFPSANINTESHANHHSRSNHDWFWFESPVLKKDTRIFGEIKLRIWSTVHRRYITVTPSVSDIDPATHVAVGNNHVAGCTPEGATGDSNECTEALVSVTRGFLDSRYRNGLDKEVDLKPGKSTGMTVVMKPQDYTFRAGHQIGLQVATEILEWHLPKPISDCAGFDPAAIDPNSPQAPACAYFKIDWEKSQTKLILPVVNAPKDPSDLFDLMAGHDH
ncbi:MAG: CocE/NonD family hydrolase [Actinomycetota bacterium]|nr:CocE/NonD family hydrolase [Actinomycetota bacterium]